MLKQANPNLLLVNMPWATGHRPSIPLAILRSLAVEEGLPVRTFYANLDMAAVVGFETAGRFADERTLFGYSEHIFACDMFGADKLESDYFLQALAELMATFDRDEWRKPFTDMKFLRHLRDDVVPEFLDRAAERVIAMNPDIIGFTATFNQVMSSLALARRVKALKPEVAIIAGGACFDEEMGREFHRVLPELLDHVFMGEAEESFVEYLRRFKAGVSTRGIPGVTTWVDGAVELVPGRPLADMNQSPSPDYDDFFSEKERLQKETGKIFNIETMPFESSRGCWWGQKNHCTFCGINDNLMAFRPKDVDRVIEEIVMLSARYGMVKLTATDYILSRWHCDELFARLKELSLDLEIFYEVRADLKKAQMMAMKEAGVIYVQPGIESFSTPVLKLMKKGTTGIRHVQFLRWAKEIGIHAAYNILACFPGEDPAWYFEMTKLIPRLHHLQPPSQNVTPIEMHRFAPLFEKRHEMGVKQHDVRPDYSFNFPAGMADPMKIAYFFTFESPLVPKETDYLRAVEKVLDPWLDAHKKKEIPLYDFMVGAGFVRIRDTRHGEGRYVRLADMHRDVVLLCDQIQGRRALADQLRVIHGKAVEDGTLARVIDELIRSDILMAEGEHLLTLPICHKPRSTESLRELVFGPAEAVPAEAVSHDDDIPAPAIAAMASGRAAGANGAVAR
jgi:ribosomal peptide maturation radical SAM protein 1